MNVFYLKTKIWEVQSPNPKGVTVSCVSQVNVESYDFEVVNDFVRLEFLGSIVLVCSCYFRLTG